MHITYHTEGVVLGGHNVGEGHRMISVFTRDFGLVHVFARSVREERSKLRYSLQEYSHSTISLVRGKEYWRIVGAQLHRNFYNDMRGDRARVLLLARISSLFRRLVQGEEQHEELYNAVYGGLAFLADHELSREQIEDVEHLLVLRMLYLLGYVSKQGNLELYLGSMQIADTILQEVPREKRIIRNAINQALKEAQL